MQEECDQVQALVRKYRRAGITVEFKYLNEKDPMYKKIDKLAKRSRAEINRILE